MKVHFAICLFLGLLSAASGGAATNSQSDSTVIHYYLKNLDSCFTSSYIFNLKAEFSVEVKSIYHQVDYRGTVRKADTALFRIFFSSTRIDSVQVLDSAHLVDDTLPKSLGVLPVWNDNYIFSLFPNDPGQGTLAIGFDNPVGTIDRPTGFLTLDRNSYFLKSLNLQFPEKKGYLQYSESSRFDLFQNYLRLKQIEINGSMETFTGRKYFRQAIEFSDYKFIQK